MNIYRWWSKALKNYRYGHIIAIGENIEEARNVARFGFEKWIEDNREYILPQYNGGDREDYDQLLAEFEADIITEPDIDDRFYILGSE